MSYAEHTEVPVERSKAELDALLQKYGAAQRGIAVDDNRGIAIVTFRLAGRDVRLQVPLPALTSVSDARLPRCSPAESQRKRWQQLCRARWRAVVLLVRAKLELIELGVSSYEREFLADIYLPDGRTVGEALAPQLQSAYSSGVMPPLLVEPKK